MKSLKVVTVVTMRQFLGGEMNEFVYLYGPSGCGKTRLLKAIENFSYDSHIETLRINAEMLVNEAVESIRSGDIDAFRRKYLEPEVLLVDDLWVLKGKKHTTREIFNLFAALIRHGRLIVAAGDLSPSIYWQGNREVEDVFQSGVIINMA